jgi:lauroyl/myristoyl acyltransferase
VSAPSSPQSWHRTPVRWISHGFNNGRVFTLALWSTRLVPWPFDWLIIQVGARVLRRVLTPATEGLIANLRVVFPEESDRALYRRTLATYVSYAWDYVAFIRAIGWRRERVLERFAYEHGDRLTGALALGRGVILVTGHFGNWEAGGVMMRALHLPLTVVAMAEPDPTVNAYRRRLRESLGADTLEVRQSIETPLQIRRKLAENRVVAMLIDRHVDRDRVPVRFFGREVLFLGAPGLLGYLTGAPLVPIFLVREGRSRFRVLPEEPILVDRTAPRDAELRRVAQRVADALERHVRARPECWYQFFPYFEAAAADAPPPSRASAREATTLPAPERSGASVTGMSAADSSDASERRPSPT